jgi:CHASE3 domain sensor protein
VLQSLLQEGNTADEVAHLNNLVSEKIGFSKMVLEAYRDGGKAAGEAVINTGRGKHIRDSIMAVILELDSIRHFKLRQLAGSVETNATKARTWGIGLGIVAGTACLLTFLYLLNTGRHQHA